MVGRPLAYRDLSEQSSSDSRLTATPPGPDPFGGSCKRIYSVRNAGGGRIHFAWQKSSGSLLASSIEGSHCVYIHSRQGVVVTQLPLKGNCTGLAWDEDGDFLAIMTEVSSIIVLWDSHSKKMIEIESNIKDPGTCLVWSKTSKILAYTTSKGNLLVYNHQTLRKVPIIGKHTKKIIAAAWSNDNMLALATIDNQLSINTIDGDAVRVVSLRAKPCDLKFGHIKEDASNSSVDNTVSLIIGEKTLYLLKVEDSSSSPLELGFQPRYGNIVSHYWHGDGYILCCFSGGFIVMISSHHREIGSELVLTELKNEPLRAAALSQQVSRFAVCYGDNIVEIRDAADTSHVVTTANLYEAEGKIRPAIQCAWSHDGQLLAVLTSGGDLHVFLTTVPLLGATYAQYVVQMSSLCDATIHVFQDSGSLTSERTIRLEAEPTLLAASSYHFVVASNNRVWFYSFVDVLDNLSKDPLFVKGYNANVHEICMNDEYVAVRSGDKVSLHSFENGLESKESENFPDNSTKRDVKITTHGITKEYFLYALDNGLLKMFSLEHWCEVAAVKLPSSVSIKRIYTDETDCNILLVDRNASAYLYDIMADAMYTVPEFPTRHDGVLWDSHEKTNFIFIVYGLDSTTAQLYIYRSDTILGSFVEPLGNVELFSRLGQKPLVLRAGKVYYQTAIGQIESSDYLYTAEKLTTTADKGKVDEAAAAAAAAAVKEPHFHARTKMISFLKFKNFAEAYAFCVETNTERLWEDFGIETMRAMELQYAVKAYSKLKNHAMVLDLQKIIAEGDFKISCGHVAILLGEFDLAQECYIFSSEPYSALRLRMTLTQWDQAEKLALEFADDYICEVTAKFAIQEENFGNYMHALELYEKAYEHSKSYEEDYPEELALCEAGIARNSIKSGFFKRGIDIALASSNPKLLKDCAEGLELAKCYSDAAYLYEECQEWDKAALLYIRIKNWERVGSILPRIRSSRIYIHYARAKESEGKYLEAAEAFEKAKDVEGACRMFTKINQPDDAIRLVKKYKSIAGALVTARYFEACQDYDTAIRFLILSNCHDDALAVAFRYGNAELYVNIVQDLVSNPDYGNGHGRLTPEYKDGIKKVALYFENIKDNVKAGKHFLLCGLHRKAFIILMKSASNGVAYDEESLLTLLTEAAAACNDPRFEQQYVEFCLGEKDGIPKDPNHLLLYYLIVRKYSEAVTTVLVMASDYLKTAGYKLAHTALFTTCRTFKQNKVHIPKDLMEEMITTHYYVLARLQGSAQNNLVAARLHQRLLGQLNKFPTHAVQILAQTIIFSQKAGLQRTAMDTCYTIMKPENRQYIPEQYKAKFETMMRKHGKAELRDLADVMSPCPYCDVHIPNFELTCAECRSDIPFCIASGRHLIAKDLTACPSCDFPAIRSEIFQLLKISKNPTCPMCDQPVELQDWVLINEQRPYLNLP